MRYFITGTAGFIGFHLARRLLCAGHAVLGYDGLTDYYDVRLKRARQSRLETFAAFTPVNGMLEDAALLRTSLGGFSPDAVIHLAAQAGVRYSIEHPETYVSSNLVGTFNLLEALRATPVRHTLLASTSSIYGASDAAVFTESGRTDFPLSIYAATKRGTEALAHSYAHLFAIPTTLMRFFTVYGPWGRPDMAPHKFASAILEGRPIEVYGEGRQSRDFTCVDDAVEAVVRLIDAVPVAGDRVTPGDSISPVAPWRTVNVGGGAPVPLMEFIAAFEAAFGRPAIKTMLPMQPGDVSATHADTTLLRALTGFVPATPVEQGVRAFVDWFRTEWPAIASQT
jgi:UDP-glucuronate 4-epimerase